MLNDICANRHRGNSASVAANERIAPSKLEIRRRIYQWFLEKAADGATGKDVTRCMGLAYTTASARLSELKADGWLVDTGKRREGAAVLRAVSAEDRQQRSMWQ